MSLTQRYKKLLLLLTVFSFMSLKIYCQNTDSSIVRKDTLREINKYLAKGVEARKELSVYKKIVKTDSFIISKQDSFIDFQKEVILSYKEVIDTQSENIEKLKRRQSNKINITKTIEALLLLFILFK